MHGLVAFEGAHLERIGTLLRLYGLRQGEPARAASEYAQVERHFDGPENRAACQISGWTVVLDPARTLWLNDAAGLRASQQCGGRVLGAMVGGSQGSLGFVMFAGGMLRRKVFILDGMSLEDEGSALREEQGLDWNLAGEVELRLMLKRMGIDYSALRSLPSYMLLCFGDQPRRKPAERRPWWRR